jgi:hypothetical protein
VRRYDRWRTGRGRATAAELVVELVVAIHIVHCSSLLDVFTSLTKHRVAHDIPQVLIMEICPNQPSTGYRGKQSTRPTPAARLGASRARVASAAACRIESSEIADWRQRTALTEGQEEWRPDGPPIEMLFRVGQDSASLSFLLLHSRTTATNVHHEPQPSRWSSASYKAQGTPSRGADLRSERAADEILGRGVAQTCFLAHWAAIFSPSIKT